jgi:hypothetical protein
MRAIGEVLDQSQLLRGRRDIGIRWGTIEAVELEIPASRTLRVLDASGKLVKTDQLVGHHSAGDDGANNFAAFRRFIVAQTRTRLYAFIAAAADAAMIFAGGPTIRIRVGKTRQKKFLRRRALGAIDSTRRSRRLGNASSFWEDPMHLEHASHGSSPSKTMQLS